MPHCLRHFAPVALLASLACAGSNALPPGSGTGPLSTWTVPEADTSVHVLYAHNNTTEPMTVTAITILRCENIRQNCGDHPVNVVILPGKTVDVFRVQRLSDRLGWSREYRMRTAMLRTAVIPPPTPPVAISAGSAPPVERPVAVTKPPPPPVVMTPGRAPFVERAISVDSFRALVPAVDGESRCAQNMTIPDLPAGHRALLLLFSASRQHGARGVMVRFDAHGNAYDYSETRNGLPGDSTLTTIALDLVRQTGLLRNANGPAQTEWFHVAGPDLLTAESLGRPGEMIARVKRECGARP